MAQNHPDRGQRVDRDLDDFVPSNPPFKLCKSHHSDSANTATGFAVTCCAFAEKSLAYQRHWVCFNRHDWFGFKLLMRRMSIEALCRQPPLSFARYWPCALLDLGG